MGRLKPRIEVRQVIHGVELERIPGSRRRRWHLNHVQRRYLIGHGQQLARQREAAKAAANREFYAGLASAL